MACFVVFLLFFPLSTLSGSQTRPPHPPTLVEFFRDINYLFFPVVMKLFRSLTISAGCVWKHRLQGSMHRVSGSVILKCGLRSAIFNKFLQLVQRSQFENALRSR